MANEDIRWIQRFNNYRKALARLGEAVGLTEQRELSDLEQQGLIQGFEFTFDLAWKTLQDYLRDNGKPDLNGGPNVVIAEALNNGVIQGDEAWKEIKLSRDLSSHSYNEETADKIADNILTVYYNLFIQLETRLQLEKINQQNLGKQQDLFNEDDTKAE